MFDKVVKLSVNQRVQGSDDTQVLFKEILKHLRTGDSTKEDWELHFKVSGMQRNKSKNCRQTQKKVKTGLQLLLSQNLNQ